MSEDLDTSKQTAVEQTEGAAKPDTEGKANEQGVVDDVDKALSEWDAEAGSSQTEQQKPEGKPEDADLRAQVNALREEQYQRTYREDFGRLVGTIRGDFTPEEVSDKFIGVWVNAEAEADQRLQIAWRDRDKDPAKFQRTVKALAQKFAKENARLRRRDDEATATREAVAHAVRGGATKPPEGKAPDLGKMSDAEARAAVEKEYGYTPRF